MPDPEQSLDTVLGGLLTALTGAQDQSNRLSRSLALEYRQDALLRQFDIPVGTVDDAEFDVAFAIDGIHDPARLAAPAPPASAPPAAGPAIDPGTAVHAAVSLVVRALRDMADHAQDAGRTEEADHLSRIAAATGSSRFEQYLAGEVDRALSAEREQAQLAGRTPPDAAAQRRTAMGVLEDRLLNHPDLAPLVGTATRRGGLLRDRISDAIGADDRGTTPAAAQATDGAAGSASQAGSAAPALGIAVEAGVLARLPSGMLDRMKVHTTVRGLRWKMVRDEDGTPQYVLHGEG